MQTHTEFAMEKKEDVMRTVLLVILILMLLGSVPVWPYSHDWGYYPVGGLGTILIVLVILALMGRL